MGPLSSSFDDGNSYKATAYRLLPQSRVRRYGSYRKPELFSIVEWRGKAVGNQEVLAILRKSFRQTLCSNLFHLMSIRLDSEEIQVHTEGKGEKYIKRLYDICSRGDGC